MTNTPPPATRVLFLTTDYPPDLGGLQTYSLRLARDLPGGLLTAVIAGSDHPAASLPTPAPGIRFVTESGRDRVSALGWSFRRLMASRLARAHDLSLHMQWSTALPAWLLRKLGLGKPYVILVHGAELLDPGRPIFNRIKALVLSGADAVAAGSQATANLYLALGLTSRRLEVIPYGNPLPPLSPGEARATPPPGPPRLLCMHRLVPRKGTALLLHALSRLKDLPWSLKVVGRGEEEASLKSLATELGLGPRVAFEPPVEEDAKAALLDATDLFVLPSLPPSGNNHMEGLGLTLLEAQGRGAPVLAARTGGIPEALVDGGTGLLFAAGDATDLEAKLRTLLVDGALRARLGAAGPAFVRERYDWGQSLAKLARLMNDVAGKPRRTSLRPS